MAYRNIDKLKPADECIQYEKWMLEELIKCSRDIVYFAENYCSVLTKKGVQKIELYDFQKKLLVTYTGKNRKPGKSRNVVVLFPRQAGKTTISVIYLLHCALFTKDERIAILANKEKLAITILTMLKDIYMELPYWMQVGIADNGWNATTLQLGNGSRIECSSSSPTAIRGLTMRKIYCDEFAFLGSNLAKAFVDSVFPVVASDPSGENSQIIITSTPNGLNHFYKLYNQAEMNMNDFTSFRIKWNEVPGRDDEYRKRMISQLGITSWLKEYDCFIGETEVTIQNKDSEEFTIAIKDLYDLIMYDLEKKYVETIKTEEVNNDCAQC